MGNKQTNRRVNRHNVNNQLKKVPHDVDGRLRQSIRFRQIVSSIVRLAGSRHPPEITEQIAKEYAGLVIRQEQHQSRLFGDDGRGTSDHTYCKLVNSANRCLRLLGVTKIEDGEDDGDVNALEKYCARKREEGNSKHKRKKDRRRERMGKNL